MATRAEIRQQRLEEIEGTFESGNWAALEGEAHQYFRDYSAEERRRMAKSGAALPDGSFPIANCDDWNNARRAIGRTPPSNRGRVQAHIAKRGNALGCKAAD